jgi:hypothetical protein
LYSSSHQSQSCHLQGSEMLILFKLDFSNPFQSLITLLSCCHQAHGLFQRPFLNLAGRSAQGGPNGPNACWWQQESPFQSFPLPQWKLSEMPTSTPSTLRWHESQQCPWVKTPHSESNQRQDMPYRPAQVPCPAWASQWGLRPTIQAQGMLEFFNIHILNQINGQSLQDPRPPPTRCLEHVPDMTIKSAPDTAMCPMCPSVEDHGPSLPP